MYFMALILVVLLEYSSSLTSSSSTSSLKSIIKDNRFSFHHYNLISSTSLLSASASSSLSSSSSSPLSLSTTSTSTSSDIILTASNAPLSFLSSLLSPLKNGKALAIVTLVVQQSLLIILMRLSRINKLHKPRIYLASTAVLMCELIKLIVSVILYYSYKNQEEKRNYSINKASLIKVSLISELFKYPNDLWKISIPSLLYVIQNNLLYIASSNVPAEIFQILSQGKIVTTALFSTLMLGKKLNKIQWLSIVSLSLGVGLVQNSLVTGSQTAAALTQSNILIGSSSILGYVLISGIAGAYLEGIIKSRKNVSLWTRNIQLGISSIIFAVVACFKDYDLISKYGFFQQYDPLVVAVIFLQALGGLVISMVVKQTSSVIKGFVTAASVVLSCLLSSVFINDFSPFNLKFLTGTLIVISSVVSYSYSQTINNKIVKKKE